MVTPFAWLKKKVGMPVWLVVIVGLVVIGGITAWLLVTDFGKYSGLEMAFPQSKKLENISYLECRRNVWGHLHTRNDVLQTGTSGWTKNVSDEKSGIITVEIVGSVVKVSEETVSGVGGDFQIIDGGISSPRLLAQEMRSYQSYTEGQLLLIDSEIGQLIISRTQNFGNGLLSDSLIYTCESKVNPNLTASDRAIGLLVKIEEVKKIQSTIEQAGNKIFFLSEGEENGEQRVEMGEDLADHTSRIATFYVDVLTEVITVEDLVNNRRVSLEEWKAQVRKDWNF